MYILHKIESQKIYARILNQEGFSVSKRVFRPFWSYDVVKTEEWLSQMHADGYALVSVNFASRLFHFEETMPAKMFYRIVPEKKI